MNTNRKKVLFWNIKKKKLTQEIITLIEELSVDIIILAEVVQDPEKTDVFIDSSSLANEISENTNLEYTSRFDSGQKIVLIDNLSNGVAISVDEDSRVSICKYNINREEILIVGVHLRDAYTHDTADLSQVAGQHRESIDNYDIEKVIIVGDFNLNPYEDGIMGFNGFNAIFNKNEIIYNPIRKFGIKEKKFYYNPTWETYQNTSPQGTYYYSNNMSNSNPYWQLIDQVLFSPAIMDKYIQSSFKIITEINGVSLLRDKTSRTTRNTKKVLNEAYSDHLPIVFEINI